MLVITVLLDGRAGPERRSFMLIREDVVGLGIGPRTEKSLAGSVELVDASDTCGSKV